MTQYRTSAISIRNNNYLLVVDEIFDFFKKSLNLGFPWEIVTAILKKKCKIGMFVVKTKTTL